MSMVAPLKQHCFAPGRGCGGPRPLQELPKHQPALLGQGPECVPTTLARAVGAGPPGRGGRARERWVAQRTECRPHGQQPGEAGPRPRSPMTMAVTVGRAGSASGQHPECLYVLGHRPQADKDAQLQAEPHLLFGRHIGHPGQWAGGALLDQQQHIWKEHEPIRLVTSLLCKTAPKDPRTERRGLPGVPPTPCAHTSPVPPGWGPAQHSPDDHAKNRWESRKMFSFQRAPLSEAGSRPQPSEANLRRAGRPRSWA